MAKKEAVGHMVCPECGFPDAEIKEDKNGNPYRYCPDCSAQYMTHGRPHKVKNLMERMKPVAAAVAAAVEGMAGGAAVAKPEAAAKRGGFLL